MAKIVEYSIITAKDAATLQKRVNRKIQDGWQPHGTLIHLDGRLVQAMVIDRQSLDRLRKSSQDGTQT